MLLFDEAFDVMLNTKNIKGVVESPENIFLENVAMTLFGKL